MSSTGTYRALVVDDQPNWREALKILLETEGFDVSEAGGLMQAQDLLHDAAFDIVVLDVRLVDEDTFNVEGLALLEVVRGSCPYAYIVLITGYSQSINDSSGADRVILKVPPGATFDILGFRTLVRSLVNRDR